jgi:hypothetical protein
VSLNEAVGLTPEQKARAEIDRPVIAAGWDVRDAKQANIRVSSRVPIRNFMLANDYGFADYVLYVDAPVAEGIEIGWHAATLSGIGGGFIQIPREAATARHRLSLRCPARGLVRSTA